MAVSANITMMCASAGGQSIACLLDHSSEYLHSAVSSVSVELTILLYCGLVMRHRVALVTPLFLIP